MDEKELEEKRFELEKFKIEQEAEVQRARLTLDQEKAKHDEKFRRNPALISAAISLAAVLVSGAQVWVAHISKEKDLAVAERQNQREIEQRSKAQEEQFVLERAKIIIDHRTELFSGDPATSQRMAQLVQTMFPAGIASKILAESPYGPGNAAPARNLAIQKFSGDKQIISFGHWQNFSARVVDENNRPVSGAKVVWQMPEIGTLAYVGATDNRGISTATNMGTFSVTGTHLQTAEIADRDTPVGFTDGTKVRRLGARVEFKFSQE